MNVFLLMYLLYVPGAIKQVCSSRYLQLAARTSSSWSPAISVALAPSSARLPLSPPFLGFSPFKSEVGGILSIVLRPSNAKTQDAIHVFKTVTSSKSVNNLWTSSFLLFYVCLPALIIISSVTRHNWDQKLLPCCCNSWSPHPPSNDLQSVANRRIFHCHPSSKKKGFQQQQQQQQQGEKKVHKFVKITKIGFTNSIPKICLWVFLWLLCFCLLVQLLNKTPQPH